jgi:hypothetical protein
MSWIIILIHRFKLEQMKALRSIGFGSYGLEFYKYKYKIQIQIFYWHKHNNRTIIGKGPKWSYSSCLWIESTLIWHYYEYWIISFLRVRHRLEQGFNKSLAGIQKKNVIVIDQKFPCHVEIQHCTMFSEFKSKGLWFQRPCGPRFKVGCNGENIKWLLRSREMKMDSYQWMS